MKIEISRLVDQVMLLIGEGAVQGEEGEWEPTGYIMPGTDLRGLIGKLLPEAARQALREIPCGMAGDAATFSNLRLGSGSRILGNRGDILRLLYFRMADWEHGVSSAMEAGGELYSLRTASPLGRLRRRLPRKGVAILPGGRIEVFGSQSDTVAELVAIIDPEVGGGYLEIPAGAEGEVVRKGASMALEILGRDMVGF